MNTVCKVLVFVLLSAATAFASVPAQAAEVGDHLSPFILQDQFGTPHELDASVRRIFYNSDRKSDALLKSALAEGAQSRLDAQHAIVVSNISAVPFFIKGLVLSNLKDRHYIVWLDTKGSTASLFPRRDDQVTVIDLDELRVTALRYAADLAGLRQELSR